ncbi:MAG: hypothetical protein ACI9J2_002864 [Saprospiraceae bacterium]
MNESDEQESAPADRIDEPPLLTPIEARVLACLMEKELTVPDTYPLTLNSLVLACNQKSNREPQMNLSEGEVGHIAKDLAERDYIKIEYGERAHKFEHNCRKQLSIDKAQQALLTVMMLRAPQTLNDLKTRTARMAEFDDLNDVEFGLESLNSDEANFMQHLPKTTGQREDRYTHLLCGSVEIAAVTQQVPAFVPTEKSDAIARLEMRIEELEKRLTELENLNE